MGLFKPKHPYADGMFICGHCREELIDPPMADASIDCGELGEKEEWVAYCPYCRDENLIPAHYCENPGCMNYAEEDERLCTACKNILTKKYLDFVSALTLAEKEELDDLLDSNAVAEIAESLRKSGEWQRERL